MTITTKYNIGDTVWFMDNNKATNVVIINIQYSYMGHPYKIHYSMKHGLFKAEEDVYINKEQLLKSL